ncbi:TorD/DmsD family molecular chaperone [Dethiosulfatarculus sandiegensis]|uniref:Molecular chaperone TorD n=1 Tax=Dethiosulfatarculus sandiegensis TaxID=1429043 RepID=A0A0D2GI16_9BACT|nr:molecular chaperone TorD family protein [Dethiosulfatarculus sandiegensis]KIX14477.1 hypothetical protein X474_10410 [Dethiosulfatarculus sandiegensis]
MPAKPDLTDRLGECSLDSPGFHSLREALYTLLAHCFGFEIDQNAWAALGQLKDMTEAYLDCLGGPDHQLQQEAADLGQLIEELTAGGGEKHLLYLAREYASSFLGVGPNTIPLCESHYTDSNHAGQDSPALRVRRQYQRAGLTRSESFNELEDHLSMELSLMAHLSARSKQAAENSPYEARKLLEWQSDFIQGHLLNWIPAFRSKAAQMSPAGFYAKIACFTDRFLELEDAWIVQEQQSILHGNTEAPQKLTID